MKTKQDKLRAKLPLKSQHLENAHCHKKQRVNTWKVIDKTTEKTIVACVVSGTGQTVYADLWVSGIKANKVPKNSEYTYTVDSVYDNEPPKVYTDNSLSGKGSAGGYGYDKTSSAIGDAIDSCGITLWGTVYHGQAVDFKKQVYIGGTGNHEHALLAIAHACGYNNCILVRA